MQIERGGDSTSTRSVSWKEHIDLFQPHEDHLQVSNLLQKWMDYEEQEEEEEKDEKEEEEEEEGPSLIEHTCKRALASIKSSFT
jgi:hypothetical protein